MCTVWTNYSIAFIVLVTYRIIFRNYVWNLFFKNSTLLKAKLNVYYIKEQYYAPIELPYYFWKLRLKFTFQKQYATEWAHYKSYCVTVLNFEITLKICFSATFLKSRRNKNCIEIKCNVLFSKSCIVTWSCKKIELRSLNVLTTRPFDALIWLLA